VIVHAAFIVSIPFDSLSRRHPVVVREHGKTCKVTRRQRDICVSIGSRNNGLNLNGTLRFLLCKIGLAGRRLAICLVRWTTATRGGGSDEGDCVPHVAALAQPAVTMWSTHNCINATVGKKGILCGAAKGGDVGHQSVTFETIDPNGKPHFSYFGQLFFPTVRLTILHPRLHRHSIWCRRRTIANNT
jgi:hypothetical protein